MKTFRILVTFGVTSLASIMQGQSTTIGTATKIPVLVELFTSEGCSSCPPADALLERMDTAQPVAGAQLIVLSEHVDYWDHEGWKDPHSSSSATERQNNYVRALGLKTAFTPQFVVDGVSEFGMDTQAQAREAFRKAVANPKLPIDIDAPTIENKNPPLLHARIDVDGTSQKHSADVYVVVALDRVESQVSRGENTGKHLTHVAVVEEFKRIGKLEKGGKFEHDLDLKLKSGIANDLRIIVFVQESGPGKVLGAAFRKVAS
jgi:hypothetical protein